MKRRQLLKTGLATLGGIAVLNKAQAQTVAACQDLLTPPQTKGPFYPVIDQLDKDSDLVVVAGRTEPARGQVVLIEGIVTDQHCQPVEGALVEIWQACESGKYNHPSDPNQAPLDPNFQYWGKAVTNKKGFYRFRTIIPGAYPADAQWMRPPHIHYKVAKLGYRELITQMYFAGEALNAQDLILLDLPIEDQKKVIVEFKAVQDLPHPVGNFNIQIMKLRRP